MAWPDHRRPPLGIIVDTLGLLAVEDDYSNNIFEDAAPPCTFNFPRPTFRYCAAVLYNNNIEMLYSTVL